MRTVPVGNPKPAHLAYHRAAREALLACEAELRPGRTAGDVYAAHARVLDERGLGAHRLNACGYSLGAKFTPSWMDWPMFYEANPWDIRARHGGVRAHDPDGFRQLNTAMTLGRTSLVGEHGAEALTVPALDLVIR